MHGVSFMIRSAKIFDFKLRRDYQKNLRHAYQSVDGGSLS